MSESTTPGNRNDQVELSPKALRDLCFGALHSAGASEELAGCMANATVEAERRGRSSTGAIRVIDSIAALQKGRLKRHPDPAIESRRAAIIAADADDGPAHLAFDRARERFTSAARETGIAMLGIERSHAWGELGYLAAEIATQGFIALAGTNSPALMSIFGAGVPVTGTNPFAFAVPSGSSRDGSGAAARPRLIDRLDAHCARLEAFIGHDYGRRRPLPETISIPRHVYDPLAAAAATEA